jgi:hypothetical protein
MSSILEGLHTTQVLKEDAERLAQLEMAYRQAKEITKDIKYDDTVMGITSRIQELGQKYNIDPRSIKYAISDVQEAKNNLESAVYSLDEVFKDAYEDLKWRLEDEENLQEISDFKRKEIEFELRHEKNNYAVSINGKVWKVFADEKQANNIARSLRNKGKDAKVYPTGAEVSEGYRAGAVGGAGLGIEKSPIEKVLEKPIKCSPVDEHINTPGGMGQAYRKFTPKTSKVEEEQAPMFTPEDEAKMINANDPKSAGWRRTESSIMKGLQNEAKVTMWSKDNPPPPELLLNTLIQILMKPENHKTPQDLINLWNEKYGLKHTLGSLRQYAQNDYKKMELSKALQKSALANESSEGK